MSSQLASVPGGGNILIIVSAGTNPTASVRWKKRSRETYNEHNQFMFFHEKLYTLNDFQNRRNSSSLYAFSHESLMVSCNAGFTSLSDMFSYLGSRPNDAREVRNIPIRGW